MQPIPLFKPAPLQFDGAGQPCWVVEVPRSPRVSLAGHPLPYLHPQLQVARPARWEHPKSLWVAFAMGLLLPATMTFVLALKGLSGNKPVRTSGISGWLQQQVFRMITLYQDDWSQDPVQVGVMFPGEVAAWPVDVGVLEPLLVLHAMGVPTRGSCEGHEGRGLAYVGLKEGHRFPVCLLEFLQHYQIGHEELSRGLPGTASLHARENNEEFSAALRAWARDKALEFLPAC